MSLFNTSRLLNKTILITGASSGIGAVSLMITFSPALSSLKIESSGNGDFIRKGDDAATISNLSPAHRGI
jgi:hypothetical protein